MQCREFITLAGEAIPCWPLAVWAQQAGKLSTIGFQSADATAFSPWTTVFVGRLRELGWIEGRTVAIEFRWSDGRPNATPRSQRSLFVLRSTSLSQLEALSPRQSRRVASEPIRSDEVFCVGRPLISLGI